VLTAFTRTSRPVTVGEVTVIGTYAQEPLPAVSRSRYVPGGHPIVATSAVGVQTQRTVRCPSTTGRGWRRPGSRAEDHTARAPTPPYHPRRNACTVNHPTVAVTNTVNGSPGETLLRLAYPASSAGPAVRAGGKSHPAVPDRSFSDRTHPRPDHSPPADPTRTRPAGVDGAGGGAGAAPGGVDPPGLASTAVGVRDVQAPAVAPTTADTAASPTTRRVTTNPTPKPTARTVTHPGHRRSDTGRAKQWGVSVPMLDAHRRADSAADPTSTWWGWWVVRRGSRGG